MDLNKLRTQVFEKTGIRIDTGDPVFALVALNEAVLEECVEHHIAALHAAAEELTQESQQLLNAGDRVKKLLLQLGQTVEEPSGAVPARKGQAAKPSAKETSTPPWSWIAATAVISALSCVLVLAVQTAFGYTHPSVVASLPAPVAAPAPTTPLVRQAPPALTPEQVQMMQDGERYAKMWPKLDAKTQAKIQELSQ